MLFTRMRRHMMSYECRRVTVTRLRMYALLQIDK